MPLPRLRDCLHARAYTQRAAALPAAFPHAQHPARRRTTVPLALPATCASRRVDVLVAAARASYG